MRESNKFAFVEKDVNKFPRPSLPNANVNQSLDVNASGSRRSLAYYEWADIDPAQILKIVERKSMRLKITCGIFIHHFSFIARLFITANSIFLVECEKKFSQVSKKLYLE